MPAKCTADGHCSGNINDLGDSFPKQTLHHSALQIKGEPTHPLLPTCTASKAMSQLSVLSSCAQWHATVNTERLAAAEWTLAGKSSFDSKYAVLVKWKLYIYDGECLMHMVPL